MENGETPNSKPKPILIPPFAIWLAVGLLGGFGIAMAAMNAFRPTPVGDVLVAQREYNGETTQVPATDQYSADSGDPALLTPNGKSNPGTPDPTKAANGEYAADQSAKNPAPNQTQPPPLQGGSIGTTGGAVEPLSPTVVIGDKPPAEVEHFEYIESTAETEFDGELAQAVSAIRKAGGQILIQFEFDPERPERKTEVFAMIDHKNASKLRDAMKQATGGEISQWSGTNSERIGRMQRSLREERSRLATLLADYQVRYMDDAPQVLETKAAVARFDQALGALRRVGEDKATIRLTIGR